MLLPVLGIAACSGRTDLPEGLPDEQIQREARARMVTQQLEARGVSDRLVLGAMRTVPRHEFLPEGQRPLAYTDQPLPIGHQQTISQPYIVALMTEVLQLERHERVLEIGTGSGYQAAVLAEITPHVYSVEIVEPLAESARRTLQRLGYTSVEVRAGDGYLGWPEHAPFDAIIVTAAPDHVPQPLIDQLAPGGRMVIPVGSYYQELMLLVKGHDGGISRQGVIPVRFVPMTGEAARGAPPP